MATPDITIYGAGVIGLTIAFECQSRGATVQVIDPGGVGAGASGGIVGALAPHTPENWNDKKQFQFESLMMAEDFWASVEAQSGMPTGYARTGRLQPIADEHALELATVRAANARDLWQGFAHWSIEAAADLGPWAPPSPSGKVIHDTLSGRMHPRRAAASLAQAITLRGGTILPEGDAMGTVIKATGVAGLEELSNDLGTPIGSGVKGQGALLQFDARDKPQLFADSLHIIPHADGTVAIGSTTERDYIAPDQPDGLLDDVLTRAFAAFPILTDAPIIERWAGVRPRSRSRAPMLGRHPLKPDEFIANGGFKIGFGMAPKIAKTMADLVMSNIDTIPDGFRVEASLPKTWVRP